MALPEIIRGSSCYVIIVTQKPLPLIHYRLDPILISSLLLRRLNAEELRRTDREGQAGNSGFGCLSNIMQAVLRGIRTAFSVTEQVI